MLFEYNWVLEVMHLLKNYEIGLGSYRKLIRLIYRNNMVAGPHEIDYSDFHNSINVSSLEGIESGTIQIHPGEKHADWTHSHVASLKLYEKAMHKEAYNKLRQSTYLYEFIEILMYT